MESIDWDDAFDNAGYAQGAEALPALWAERAAAARSRLAGTLDLAYAPGPRRSLDLFAPKGTCSGLVVFVHGGYWHKFDKSYWSHLAAGPVGRGWKVAVLEYPLAPSEPVASITEAVGAAILWLAGRETGPIRLAGHSAGGHLVTRMLCADSPLPREVLARIERVLSISGVHDLRPLLATRMNGTLGLSEAMAASESPVLHAPAAMVPLSIRTGAAERPEFLRQARLLAETRERQGVPVSSRFEPGQDHFSIVDSLCQPGGALTKELLRARRPASDAGRARSADADRTTC